jgi:hypothetical protein
MKNIRAIASILIIIGSILVELSYKLLSEVAFDEKFWPSVIQNLLPGMVGILLLHHGVKALLRSPLPPPPS